MAERAGTPFELWAQQEGIPIVRGYSVKDTYQVPLGDWKRKGGRGALIMLEGAEGWTGAYLCEIPPKTSLKPQRHLFEERIYVLQGQGETKVWAEGVPEQRFAWQEYSLFSPPLNARHQHINTSNEPVKYVAVTDAPLVFNIFRDEEFIYNSDSVFRSRYSAEQDYFDGIGKMGSDNMWQAGFIHDVRQVVAKPPKKEYFWSVHLALSNNSTAAHVGRLDVGAYKNAHRHTAGAHIIILNGEGYSLIWKEGGEKVKIDWQKGSIFSPPEGWFHTHFNTCQEPVIHVALRRGMYGVGKMYRPNLDIKKGGDLLEYEDEDPEIRKMFEQELAKKGLQIKMAPVARRK